jgi:cytochrome P450
LYSTETFKSGAILKLIPDFLHPIVAPFVVRECRRHFNICKEIATPIIEDRLHRMRTQGKAYEPAVDVLQWILDDAFEVADAQPYRLTVDWICSCLLLLNMVAIHTTSMVTTQTLLDLYSSPDRDELVAGLREEAERVLTISKGEWSKDAVNSLLRVDSVIRETMRVTSLGELGMPRIVSDPNGITLSGGIHLPQGVRVIMPTYSIQTDESKYENPKKWDGFRFSRPHEEFLSSPAGKVSGDAGRLEKVLEHKNRGLIVTSDDFFTFGAVRHACPGRFFASQEMKLMIAYIVMNFDIKIDGGRPPSFSFNGACVPLDSSTMDIRLRQQSA